MDDFSKLVWIYPLKVNGDTIITFNHFLVMIKTQFQTSIKSLQSDNGFEFVKVHQLCIQSGIRSRYSCPYTSIQNGRAERKHRHIVETGLTLLPQASMPLCYLVGSILNINNFNKWSSVLGSAWYITIGVLGS